MHPPQAASNLIDNRSSVQRALIFVLLPVLYYLGAKFAITYTVVPEGAAILWPPNSVLLAAMLLLGKRDLPWLALLATGAEIVADMPEFKWYQGLTFGMSNCLEAAIAFFLLQQWRFDWRFPTLTDVLKFIVAALLIAAFACAFLGAALFYYFDILKINYLEHVRILWFGDALALMIFTPLWLNLWPFGGNKNPQVKIHPSDYLAGLLALITLGLFVVSRDGELQGVHVGPTLLLPFVIYMGARFGVRWASVATAVVALLSIIMMVKGANPFGKLETREAVIQAQEFIFIMSLIALGSAALLTQLRLKQNELETANLALNDWNRNLESRVEERTTELVRANAQLEKEMRERELAEQALQAANQELKRLVDVDGLTLIANRRSFDARLLCEWKRLSRDQGALSLILFDIDFFKNYNDCYGHLAGDTCLIEVAEAASEALRRPADLLARYGGEEFAAILPDTDAAGALAVAEQVRLAIRRRDINHERSEVCRIVTVSAGVATCMPGAEEVPESLVHLADQALYRAKAQGRDCCAI